MKERPILFSAPMVRAILAGQKSQTRRIVKLRYGADVVVVDGQVWKPARVDYAGYVECPYGQPGDRLWVRESWGHDPHAGMDNDKSAVRYRADHDNHPGVHAHIRAHGGWRPSIHMPRWASRLTLEVSGVRVERLQDISEKDALEEGITYNDIPNNELDPMRARTWYRGMWESINGPGSWNSNPFVWVVEFRRIK